MGANEKKHLPYTRPLADDLTIMMQNSDGATEYVSRIRKTLRKYEKQSFPAIGAEKMLPAVPGGMSEGLRFILALIISTVTSRKIMEGL